MRGAGQDGAAQPMLMLDVGRVGGPHGQESGRWVGCARPSAVWAAVGPYRATVARVSSKFSYGVTAGNGHHNSAGRVKTRKTRDLTRDA